MSDPKGFLKFDRELPESRDPKARINDYREIEQPFPEERTIAQATRCMDCGVPFCHQGCPLGNIIPEFNESVFEEDWKRAIEILQSTNNFPEFTGRICPAPCEAACVLGINQPPVAIEHIEKTIAEKAFELGYIVADPPKARVGKRIAVIGSGPAGLAAADQLNKAGYEVLVFERSDRPGGLLRYGIPDFKLEKWVLDRRLELMKAEGVKFQNNTEVGKDYPTEELLEEFDAILLAGGATIARDLYVPGRELKGIHLAMDYLEQSNRRVAGDTIPENQTISAKGRHVVVIGGGDTGSDCVGTANRQGALSVTQLELLAQPPQSRDPLSWPNWPMLLRTSSSHEEGCDRKWAIQTRAFIGNDQQEIKALELVDVAWTKGANGKYSFEKVAGTERQIPCDLALLAIGFLHPQREGLLLDLDVEFDQRGNVIGRDYRTSVDKVFVAGDMRRGQSLVVWAISEGREAAKKIDSYLTGSASHLDSKIESMLRV